jgi:hypothetical protein
VRARLEETIVYLQGKLGDAVWRQGMNPDIPEMGVLDNPYTYTEYRSAKTHEAHGIPE